MIFSSTRPRYELIGFHSFISFSVVQLLARFKSFLSFKRLRFRVFLKSGLPTELTTLNLRCFRLLAGLENLNKGAPARWNFSHTPDQQNVTEKKVSYGIPLLIHIISHPLKHLNALFRCIFVWWEKEYPQQTPHHQREVNLDLLPKELVQL